MAKSGRYAQPYRSLINLHCWTRQQICQMTRRRASPIPDPDFNALSYANIRTIGEIRESSDETRAGFPDLGRGSIRWLREKIWLGSLEITFGQHSAAYCRALTQSRIISSFPVSGTLSLMLL
jgi:hypothetical protein